MRLSQFQEEVHPIPPLGCLTRWEQDSFIADCRPYAASDSQQVEEKALTSRLTVLNELNPALLFVASGPETHVVTTWRHEAVGVFPRFATVAACQ